MRRDSGAKSTSRCRAQVAPALQATLLEATLNAGLWIDSSCQQGVCGSCKVRMTQGDAEMDDLGGLTEAEKAEGYVLTCCARPRGVVSLDV